jgi:hypothetical protein
MYNREGKQGSIQDIGDSKSYVILGPDSGVQSTGCTTRLITKIVGSLHIDVIN